MKLLEIEMDLRSIDLPLNNSDYSVLNDGLEAAKREKLGGVQGDICNSLHFKANTTGNSTNF